MLSFREISASSSDNYRMTWILNMLLNLHAGYKYGINENRLNFREFRLNRNDNYDMIYDIIITYNIMQ